MSDRYIPEPDKYIPHPWSELILAWAELTRVNDENAALRKDCKRLVYLLNLQEDSEVSGRSFRPNQITSCRALDGKEIGEILERMGNL